MLEDDMDDEAPILTDDEFCAALDEAFRDLSAQWSRFAEFLAAVTSNGRKLPPAQQAMFDQHLAELNDQAARLLALRARRRDRQVAALNASLDV